MKNATKRMPGVGLIQDEDLLLISYSKAKEETISLRDLPRSVRATIKKHAAGGKITEVEKDIVDGTARYEAEVVRDGREYDILVSLKGKYLGTEAEEDTEDDENGDEDEDEE